jgi:hypothetical protein
MKSLKDIISEKLIISKTYNKKPTIKREFKYFPKNEKELQEIVERRFDKRIGTLDLTDIDVSQVTLFSNFLSNIRHYIKKIDVSGWDVSNAEHFYAMFYFCNIMEEIIGLDTWDMSFTRNLKTNSVYNIPLFESMFKGCTKLKKLDLSSWDICIDNCSLDYMFMGCTNLESIGDVSDWDINFSNSNNAKLLHTFALCDKLKCDISKWKYKPRNRKTAPNIKYE